uniref:Uncharacterized protein n=1 Tax=Anguilla anguilla TaxID=7936 RepID=A0A0E9TTQ4_ANGAN
MLLTSVLECRNYFLDLKTMNSFQDCRCNQLV